MPCKSPSQSLMKQFLDYKEYMQESRAPERTDQQDRPHTELLSSEAWPAARHLWDTTHTRNFRNSMRIPADKFLP